MSDKVIKGYFLRVSDEGVQFKGYVAEFTDTLEYLQGYVGGYIDVVRLNDEIDLVINDEGKIHDLPINRACVGDGGTITDFICGNILCVRHCDDEFDSILESDIAVIEKSLVPLLSVSRIEGRNVFVMTGADILPEYDGER